MNDLLKNLQDLGDAKHDDLTVAHDALAEIVNLRLINEDLLEALEELARLGNGRLYGNSAGNVIARKAIEKARGQA
jgi:hypothetical protein